MIEPHGMLEMYDIAREVKQAHEDQRVLTLWNKGLGAQRIADELGIDVDKVNDIVECEGNYEMSKL